MIKPFEFKDGGRSYSCTVEAPKGAADDTWWWFAVSGDMQRYAPFRTARGDTRESVQLRVVEFYANRLFRLTQPTVRGSHWGKRNFPAKPGEAAPTAPTPEATA